MIQSLCLGRASYKYGSCLFPAKQPLAIKDVARLFFFAFKCNSLLVFFFRWIITAN